MRALLAELDRPACLLDDEGRVRAANEGFAAAVAGGQPAPIGPGDVAGLPTPGTPGGEGSGTRQDEDGAGEVPPVEDLTGRSVAALLDRRAEVADAVDRLGDEPIRETVPVVVDGQRHDVLEVKPVDDGGALCIWRPTSSDGDGGAAMFAAVADEFPVGVVEVGPDGTITYANRAIEDLTGWTTGDLLGRPVPFVAPSSTADWQALLSRCAEGEAVDRRELLVRTTVGETRRTVASARPVHEGEEPTTVVVFEDVTRREDLTNQLQLLNRVLRHNVRTELNLVLGRARMLAEELDEEPLAGYAEEIIDASHRVSALSDKARDLSQILSPGQTVETIDVAGVVRDVLAAERDRHPEVDFELEAPETLAVRAVKKLDLAIRNLVENAAEHNTGEHQGVRVTVETTWLDGDQWGRVSVVDDGPPIPVEERSVLIDEQEDELEHGSGLGLWVVYWVVSRSGGELTYQRTDAEGNVMSVRLPAVMM